MCNGPSPSLPRGALKGGEPAEEPAGREPDGARVFGLSRKGLLFRVGYAMRPWSFTASYFPMLLTALLLTHLPATAAKVWDGKELAFLGRFCALLVAGLSVHAGANLTNTYYDFKRKVDLGPEADDRTLIDGALSPEVVGRMAAACYMASGAAWAFLVHCSGSLDLLYLAAGGSVLGWGYTAQPLGLKYHALGEPVVFLCFGPLLALASALAVGLPLTLTADGLAELAPAVLAAGAGPGLLACGILHANNARDIERDSSAKATTLAQLIGGPSCRRLYSTLLLLPYAAVAAASQLLPELRAACGWHPAAFVLLTLPIASDLHRSYQRGELAELPQQTAQFHSVFCGALAVSFLSCLGPPEAFPTLARTLLALLFVMGGGNNFYAWDATLRMVHNRLNLALPFAVPRPVAALALVAASLTQIASAGVFISGYGGRAYERAAAQTMLMFLVPVTFVVHDFWSTAKFVSLKQVAMAEKSLRLAGCKFPPPPAPKEVPTFETEQDSEFIHFFKNVCIIGGLCAFLAQPTA